MYQINLHIEPMLLQDMNEGKKMVQCLTFVTAQGILRMTQRGCAVLSVRNRWKKKYINVNVL